MVIIALTRTVIHDVCAKALNRNQHYIYFVFLTQKHNINDLVYLPINKCAESTGVKIVFYYFNDILLCIFLDFCCIVDKHFDASLYKYP